MNRNHLLSIILVILSSVTITTISSCNSEDDKSPTPIQNPTVLSDAIDQVFFKQLKSAGTVFAQNEIWENFDFANISQYVIRKDGNQTAKGFIINPSTVTDEMQKISEDLSSGIKVYRYDKQVQEAIQVLESGNGLFDFNYVIDGNNYYLQSYSKEEVENSEALAISVHENFHVYQFGWNEKQSAFQDFDNFPVTKSLLSLQMLTVEILRNIERLEDKDKLRKLLSQYVAIRTEEIKLDPSSNQLITNHSNYQELVEGTAKYIEVRGMLASNLFPTTEFAYVNTQTVERSNVNSLAAVRELVGQLVFYDTGSAVIHALEKLGVTIENLENNLYPYDMAKDYLQLSEQQLTSYLAEAKLHEKWDQIQTKANEWSVLK